MVCCSQRPAEARKIFPNGVHSNCGASWVVIGVVVAVVVRVLAVGVGTAVDSLMLLVDNLRPVVKGSGMGVAVTCIEPVDTGCGLEGNVVTVVAVVVVVEVTVVVDVVCWQIPSGRWTKDVTASLSILAAAGHVFFLNDSTRPS